METNSDVSRVEIPCDDFNGQFCTTGVDCQLAVASHLGDFPKKSDLLYYVKSLPGTSGQVSWYSELVVPFQTACDEWKKCTGITFKRATTQNVADFVIRTANSDEEIERHNLIAESFFLVFKRKEGAKGVEKDFSMGCVFSLFARNWSYPWFQTRACIFIPRRKSFYRCQRRIVAYIYATSRSC